MKRETLNGKIFICENCNKIHLEFGTFGIDFIDEEQLNEMLTFLKGIKAMKLDRDADDSPYRRKIIIPFQNTNIKTLLNAEELAELCDLITSFLNQDEYVDSRTPKNIPMKLFTGISSIQLN